MIELESQPKSDSSATELALQAEAHRGYVRSLDQRLAKIYGLGGMPFFVVLLSLPLCAALFGLWTSAMLWIPGVTLALIWLYLGRRGIYMRRDRIREQAESYGETNGLSMPALAAHFRDEDEFSFFVALYEEDAPEPARAGRADGGVSA